MLSLTDSHRSTIVKRNIEPLQLNNISSSNSNTLIYTPRGLFLTDNNKQSIKTPRQEHKITSYTSRTVNRPNKSSRTEKKKMLFNKLYGLTPEYLSMYSRAKRMKYLPLEEYQQNILNAYTSSYEVDKDNFNDLSNKFKEIREEADHIEPLPPININKIVEHVKEEEKRKTKKKKLAIKDLFKHKEENDEFEKEMDSITKYKTTNKRKYMSKGLKMLPQHIIEAFSRKSKLML